MSESSTDWLDSFYKTLYLEKAEKFLCNVNVIIRVISTMDYIVNLEEFLEFSIETNAIMCGLFPVKLCAASCHMLFGHVYFTISNNGGYGLGQVHEGRSQKLSY